MDTVSTVRECHRIAAKMLGGSEDDAGLLHFKLYEELSDVDNLCGRASGEIRSRQIVALAIHDFGKRNPEAKLFGE